MRRLLRWLPVPLWCYLLPSLAVSLGLLPRETADAPLYRPLTEVLLPLALALLLLGVDVRALRRTGAQALLAAAAGAAGIMAGTAACTWLLASRLPAQAWKGAGSLAATWTGGTMNLLAMRAVLDVPEEVFAPLILVDALIAYGWMALLVGLCGWQAKLNGWLRADASMSSGRADPAVLQRHQVRWHRVLAGLLLAAALAAGARALGGWLPTGQLVSSRNGWTVLLVTTAALGLSLLPRVRGVGAQAGGLGYLMLYLVLAATGAQADLRALRAAPAWLLVGGGTVLLHGAVLLAAGRLWRIPLGVLAVASQANVGGVVSAPLVGAVYQQSLAPVGLLLAMAGNALGTYLGVAAAGAARLLTH